MVNSVNDWFRYVMGAIFLALGISLCFVPREKLFFTEAYVINGQHCRSSPSHQR